MKETKEKFEYTYVAPTESERRVAEEIRNRYLPQKKSEDKFTKLKELDEKVKNPPTAWALVLGVAGTLIFGLGMAMVLEWSLIFWGIVVSAVGLIPVALAYPVYCWVLKRGKKKYGAQILKLSEEILNRIKE